MNIQGWVNQVNLLNTLVSALEKEKRTLQAENQRLHGYFAPLAQDHDRLVAESSALKQKNQELYNNILALNDHLRRLEGVEKVLMSKQSQLVLQKAENRRFQAIIAHKQENINQLINKISSLQNQLQQITKGFTQKIKELENRRINELKLINDQKDSKNGQLTTDISRREAMINELTLRLGKQIQRSEAQKSALYKQNQDIAQRYVQVLNANQRYSKSVLMLENHNSELKVLLEKEKTLSEGYRKEIEANKFIISKLQNELESQQTINKQNITKLNILLENLRCLVEKQSRQHSQLFARFQSLQKEKVGGESQLSNRLLQQNKIIKTLQTHNSELNLQIQGLSSQKQKIQNSNKNLRNKIEQRNLEVDTLQRRIKESESSITQKQLKNTELSRKIQQLNKNKTELQIQLQSLQQKIQELKHQNQEQKTQYKKIEDLLRQKNLTLQKQVRKLQDQIHSAQLSTLAQGQSKTQKDLQNATLRKIITQKQKYFSEQKVASERLAQLLYSKGKEIESLQATNSMLRKQLMSSLANEDSTRKQMLVQKSKQILVRKLSVLDQRRQYSRKNTIEVLKKRFTIVPQAQYCPSIQTSPLKRSEEYSKGISSQTMIQSHVSRISTPSQENTYAEI